MRADVDVCGKNGANHRDFCDASSSDKCGSDVQIEVASGGDVLGNRTRGCPVRGHECGGSSW